jgi:hypothetical protein
MTFMGKDLSDGANGPVTDTYTMLLVPAASCRALRSASREWGCEVGQLAGSCVKKDFERDVMVAAIRRWEDKPAVIAPCAGKAGGLVREAHGMVNVTGYGALQQ